MQISQFEDDQVSFELPQLPPWKTLHMKQYNQQTPLKRSRCILGVPYESEPCIQNLPSISIGSRSDRLPQREYNYSVFNESRLLTESKIDQYLKSEIATHKSVFHKDKVHDESYRPDLQLLCCDSSDEENDLTSKRLHKQRVEKPLVVGIPGYRAEELLSDLYSRGKRVCDYTSELEEDIELRRYWDWSSLSKSLGSREYHMLNRILKKETQLRDYFRELIVKGNGYIRDCEHNDYEAYLSLKQYAHQCYEYDNCVFNMDELLVYMKEQI